MITEPEDRAAKVTRAWVLHPDISSDRQRRPAAPALEEAVALAAALPDLLVVGAEIVPLPKLRAGYLFDVPVRFAEDRLEISRATFLAGEAVTVPLIEVRQG